MTDGYNLGHDCQSDLFGSSGANLQTDWSMNVCDLFFRDFLTLESLYSLSTCFPAANHSYISYLACEEYLECWLIEFGIMREYGH